MKKEVVDVLFIILLILFLGIVVYLIILGNNEGEVCKQNPLVYGVDTMSRLSNREVSCICYFQNIPGKQPIESFVVTRNKITNVKQIETHPEIQMQTLIHLNLSG